MDATYAQFATTDPLFYDKPHRRGATTAELFAPAAEVWATWSQGGDETWSFWVPLEVTLPEQGWKIHVSATAATADTTLEAVSRYCHRHGLPFKFLRDRRILSATLGKDADRRVSGKFITIYPTSPADLHLHLTELDAALSGLPGPYVLTDLRWNRGPVFVRYGAFTRQQVVDNGVNVPAVRDLDTGALVADVRTTSFHVPPWVQVPAFMEPALDQLGTTAPPGFPQVLGALHYSNAGGVYEAELDARAVILKEARPHVGWTPDGRDAVQRLQDEVALLRTLQGRVPVPAVVTTFTAHDHEYLVMERVSAPSLSTAVLTRNPLVTSDLSSSVRRAYFDWASAVSASLRIAVTALHAAGRAHGDLHPGNVLVREDNTVVLIDLEMARPIHDDGPAVIGAPGFVATDGRSAAERDLYALACIELFMFVPLIPLLRLSPGKARTLLQEAAAQFPLDQSWVHDHLVTLTYRQGPLVRTEVRDEANAPSSPDSVRAVAQTLLADATPDREDRLWPGDPAQFTEPPLSLAHGALGVLTSLHSAGFDPTHQHLEWVAKTSTSARSPRFGLLDGAAGTVWAYRRLGLHDAADRDLALLRDAHHDSLGHDLYGGLPGVGLTLLAESGDHPPLRDAALDIAHRLRARWQPADGPRKVATGTGGLLHGATGSALFALRLFEATGDPEHLRAATEAIDYDIRSLRTAPDGSLHVDEGWRLLPYLGNGSAGIGIVLAQLLNHLPDHSRYLETLDGITRAATAPFTVQSGLVRGRAGLIQFLLTLERAGFGTTTTSVALHHHVATLELHAVRHGDEVRFAGDGLLRTSCDLATGSAGVLTALMDYDAAVRGVHHNSAGLPFLTPSHGVEVEDRSPLRAARPVEGGEMNGFSFVLADA
ncbi:class III lanthionine synthetase LanKC [Microbacterium sp. ZW CA_36]|uniref:class III lanthionine synthetase LanKC n=1 Tax=Microbacterium sp. ZW CA_36 TaxID=3378078 RepID=UPI003853188A